MADKMKKVSIIVDGQLMTGVVTGTSVAKSQRASERGVKLFVLADGIEYQCWDEGAQPFRAEKSAIQPVAMRK